MGNSVLVLLYLITFTGQYILGRVTLRKLKRHYPYQVLYPYQPFPFLRSFPFFRMLFKKPQSLGHRSAAMEKMAFSGAATITASTVMIFILQYGATESPLVYRTFIDLKTGLPSAFCFGFAYAFLIFLLEQRASLYVHTIALFLLLLILIPTLTITWFHQVALIGTIGKVVSMLLFEFALARHPFLRRSFLVVLSLAGLVKPRLGNGNHQRPIRRRRTRYAR